MIISCNDFELDNIHNGRLGNQLFRYAMLLVLSQINQCDFCINSDKNISKLLDSKTLPHSVCLSNRDSLLWYKESDAFAFDKNLLNKLQGSCDVKGFFQNLNYFDDYSDIIKKFMVADDANLNHARSFMKNSGCSNFNDTACIHVRRTDYCDTICNKNKYGYVDKSYYQNILNQIEYKHLYIISDDIDRTKREFGHLGFKTKPVFVAEENEILDFYIMYLSGIGIIPNSTYSWWACYLSNINNSYKKVYVSKPWIHGRNDINLYPSSWFTIHLDRWSTLFSKG